MYKLMKVEEKIKYINELKTKWCDYKGFWFTDFTGLPVEAMRELRRNLHNNSLTYRVIKKSILERILKELKIKTEEEWMEGPVGICIGNDLVLGSRLLTEFQKENSNFKIKGVWFEGKNFSLDKIKEIATLPGREVLMAKLLTNLNSPIYGLVQVLQSILMSLVWVLAQIKDRQETRSDDKSGIDERS